MTGEGIGRPRGGLAVAPGYSQNVGAAGAALKQQGVAGADGIGTKTQTQLGLLHFKGNLNACHVAVARIIDRRMNIGGEHRQIVAASAARADGLVNHSVGVKARGSAVNVLVHGAHPSEVGGIGRISSAVKNQKIKIASVGSGLKGVGTGV